MPKLARREDDFAGLLMEFKEHKAMVDQLSERLKAVKSRLMDRLEALGEEDDRGSKWIHFDQPIAGFTSIKRERRMSVRFDEDAADQILHERGVYDECTYGRITVEGKDLMAAMKILSTAGVAVVTYDQTIDDDLVMQLYYDEKNKAKTTKKQPRLTDADIDGMFVESISWAFKAA